MPEQSFEAKRGLRSRILGSNGDLAVAAPLADGDPDPTAHTDATRMGHWFDRTAGAEGIVNTILGTDRTKHSTNGFEIQDGGVLIASRADLTALTDLPTGPGSGFGFLWVRDSDKALIYRDEDDVDTVAASASAGSAVGGSGAAGEVTFWSDPNTITSDAGFAWDNANRALSIGDATEETPTFNILGKTSGGVGETVTASVTFPLGSSIVEFNDFNAATVDRLTITPQQDFRVESNSGAIGRIFEASTTTSQLELGNAGLPTQVNAALTVAQSAITDPATTLGVSTEWNDAVDTFTAFQVSVTDTNSASGSLLIDADVVGSGITEFQVDKLGNTSLGGYFNQGGISAPALSAAGEGRIYFDSTSNTFQVSEDGGAFVNLVSSSSVSISGTPVDNQVAIWTNANTLEGDADLTFDGTNLTASSGQNATTTLGNTLIDSRTAGRAYFSHVSLPGNSDFALLQLSTGQTILNASSAQNILFQINNSSVASFSSTRFNLVSTVELAHDSNVVLDTSRNLTVVDATITGELATNDSLPKVARGNTSDLIDIGFYGAYDGGTTEKFTGLFRDADDSARWKLFAGLEAEPTSTVNTGGIGYALAPLDVGGLDSSGDIVLSGGAQPITFTDETNDLLIQGGTAATDFLLEIASNDNAGADDVALLIDSTGTSGVSDTETLFVGWDSGNSQYEIRSQATGTGTLNPISIFTEGNIGQLDLDTSGDVSTSGDIIFTGATKSIRRNDQDDVLRLLGGSTNGTDSRIQLFGSTFPASENYIIINTARFNVSDMSSSILLLHDGTDFFVKTGGARIEQGTLTDASANIDATVTWNDAVDTFTAWQLDVTDSASAAGSLLLDLQVGSVSQFSVDKSGNLRLPSGYFEQAGISAPAVSAAGEGRIYFDSTSNTFQVSENGGAYEPLVGGGGGGGILELSGTGTDNLVTSSVGAFSSAVAGMDNNIAIGRDALDAANDAAADSNIAIGTNALGALTTAANCVAVGYLALSTLTTSSGNTAVGRSAGSTHTGVDGTFVGYLSTGGSGNDVTAIGQNARATGNISTAIGGGAIAGTGFATVAVGNGAQATGNRSLAIGQNADATADNTVAVGADANIAHAGSIGIGRSAVSTSVNQCVMGSSSAVFFDMYIGGGVTNTVAGSTVDITTSGGIGTDEGGWNLSLSGGRGTGTADSGYIQMRFAPAGSTGATLNAQVVGLRYRGDVVPAAFAASADVDGMDVYTRGQDGGTHSANNPRGADLLFVPGAAGSGGSGREGRMVIQGNFKTDQGHILAGIQTVTGAGGSPDATADGTDTTFYLDGSSNTATLNLDASPAEGQLYYIKSVDSTNTVTVGRNGNNIDGAASDQTLATNESLVLHFTTAHGWRIL